MLSREWQDGTFTVTNSGNGFTETIERGTEGE